MARLARMDTPAVWRGLLLGGLTAVLIGYLAVWLPGPAAGLRLIGLELGEWIKFLGVGHGRDLFYAPPILLGLIMVALSAGWPNGRWQTWSFRGFAMLVSLLAFPAIAAITGEPRSEWLARIAGIGLVLVAIIGASITPAGRSSRHRKWWVVTVLSLLGIVLPLWQYAVIQPAVQAILRQSVGIGLGLWLNSLGFLLVLFVSVRVLLDDTQHRPEVPRQSHR